jgi:hypothetical protein
MSAHDHALHKALCGPIKRSTPAYALYVGRKFTGITVRSDPQWFGMWRVHKADAASDMVNLARAKDASLSWYRPKGLGASEIPHWQVRQTAAEASPMRFFRRQNNDVQTHGNKEEKVGPAASRSPGRPRPTKFVD